MHYAFIIIHKIPNFRMHSLKSCQLILSNKYTFHFHVTVKPKPIIVPIMEMASK